MVRKICLCLAAAVLCNMLGGCFDRREVDDLAYVIAIGLDEGKTSSLKMTLQLAVPTAISGGGGGGGGGDGSGGGDKAFNIVVVETPTLMSGINMANNFVSKQINLSHAKAIVFSKKLAQKGISQLINGIPRVREMRSSMYVVVARDSAEEYIKSVKPKLEANPAKYYEMSYRTYNYTGFSANTQFHNFYIQAKSFYSQPVAVLAGISKFASSEEINVENSTFPAKGRNYPLEGDFKAGDIPRVSDIKAEIMGLAVFNSGKMVGELDGEETGAYLMVNGQYNHAYVTFPDPLEPDKFVILNVKQNRSPIRRVELDGDKPKIYVKVRLEADIEAIQSGVGYDSSDKMHTLEEYYEEVWRETILKFLNKTAKEYHSDICGFGSAIRGKFLTMSEFENYEWLKKYKDSEFQVDVDLKIRRSGLIIHTAPISSAEGGTR